MEDLGGTPLVDALGHVTRRLGGSRARLGGRFLLAIFADTVLGFTAL